MKNYNDSLTESEVTLLSQLGKERGLPLKEYVLFLTRIVLSAEDEKSQKKQTQFRVSPELAKKIEDEAKARNIKQKSKYMRPIILKLLAELEKGTVSVGEIINSDFLGAGDKTKSMTIWLTGDEVLKIESFGLTPSVAIRYALENMKIE